MYKLVKHSDEIAGQAKNDWINQADDLGDVGVLVTDDVTDIFNRIESNQSEHEHVYFLKEEESDSCKAVLKIMQAKPYAGDQSYLKLLKIHVEPNLTSYSEKESSGQLSELYKVIASSILESIKLIFLNSVYKLKIYGRTQEMHTMFFALTNDQKLIDLFDSKGLKATTEGAWLVIQNKNNGGK